MKPRGGTRPSGGGGNNLLESDTSVKSTLISSSHLSTLKNTKKSLVTNQINLKKKKKSLQSFFVDLEVTDSQVPQDDFKSYGTLAWFLCRGDDISQVDACTRPLPLGPSFLS